MPKPVAKVRRTIELDIDTADALAEKAAKEGVSVNAIIAAAIEKSLAKSLDRRQ